MTERKKTHIDAKDVLIMTLIMQGSPSVHDMMKALDVSSPGTISERLSWLQTREPPLIVQPSFRQARSRYLTPEGYTTLYDARVIDKEELNARIQLYYRTQGAPQAVRSGA